MNRRSFFTLTGASLAGLVVGAKAVQADISVAGVGAMSGGIIDPCHTHASATWLVDAWERAESAGIPLDQRPWSLQQHPSLTHSKAYSDRILSMSVEHDRLVGPL